MKKLFTFIFLLSFQLMAEIGLINISSTSHSLGVSSNSDEVIINWITPTTTNGDVLSKYRWKFDKNTTSLLDDDLTAKVVSSSSNSLTISLDKNISDGDWFFHIIAITELGDSGIDNHFGKLVIDRTAPTILVSQQVLENKSVEISLKSLENGVSIFYTLDNSIPTENSKKYSTPFKIYSNKNLKFIGIDSSKNISVVSEKTFSVSYNGNIIKANNIIDNQIIATKLNQGASKSTSKILVSASDLKTYKYRIDSNKYSDSIDKDIGVDISKLSDGTHSIFFRGTDSIGNSQIEPTKITFTVDNTAPKYLTGKVDNQIIGQKSIFSKNKNLIISTDENATVRYTTDGDTPTKTFGTIYKDSITITNNTNLKLIAYDSLGNIGAVKNFEIIIDREKPKLLKIFDSKNIELNNLHSSFYENKYLFKNETQIFHFTSSDNYTISPKIIWTLDNSNPNLRTSNTGNVSIRKTSTLNFLAIDEVNNSTDIQSLDFIIDNNSPKSLNYILPDNCIKIGEVYNCINNKIKIKLSAIDNETPKDIKYYFTATGKAPTNNDFPTDVNNSFSINLTQNQTIVKFVAYDKVGNRSTEKSLLLKYSSESVNDSVKIISSLSLDNNSLINSQRVSKIDVNVSNGGTKIYYYYKFDRNSSFLFENNISKGIDISKLIDGNYSLSVIASNNGEVNSSVNKINFTVDNTAPENPNIIYDNKDFLNSINVSILDEDNASNIYYTLNGAIPSIESFEYNHTFNFVETTILKAIQIDKVGNKSDIISVTFNKIIPNSNKPTTVTQPEPSKPIVDNTQKTDNQETEVIENNNETVNDFNIVDIKETSSGESLLVENSNGQTKNISINFPKDVVFSDDGNRSYSLANKEIIVSNAGEISMKIGNNIEMISTLDSQTVSMIEDGIIIKGDKVTSDNQNIAEITIISTSDILDINLTVNGERVQFPIINLNGEKAKIKTYLKDDNSINIELEIPLNSHNLKF